MIYLPGKTHVKTHQSMLQKFIEAHLNSINNLTKISVSRRLRKLKKLIAGEIIFNSQGIDILLEYKKFSLKTVISTAQNWSE